MSGIVFREFQSGDMQQTLDIYNYYVVNSNATFHIRPLTPDEMKEILVSDNPKYKTFVVLDNQIICGYAIMAQYKKREAYDGTAEITVYLSHEFLGQGVGSLAVRYIEQYAKTWNIHTLIAVICGENTRSIRLFEKNGYDKCAHLKEVGKKADKHLDVVIYQKLL